MTDHKAGRPLTIGGKVLYRTLFTERRRLARRLVEQFGREIGAYRGLPGQELVDNISHATEENLRVFAESLRDKETPPPDGLAGAITASAARRAGEGIPLDAVMAAYSLGMLETWRTMVAGAQPSDLADVLACTELVMGYLQRSCTSVAAAYLEEHRRMDGDVQRRRYTLISALLRGDPLTGPAHQADVRLPARYLVLSLRFARHPDEDLPGAGGAMAAQRKAYRATEELGGQVLTMLDPTGGVVLLAEDGQHDWTSDATLVKRVSAATGVDVTAAGVLSEPGDVPRAAEQAEELVKLAETFGRGPGFYRLTDLMLEYQLTRPSPARTELGELLAPLDTHPDLLTTLATYLRLGLNRRATAACLHVHPNTIDYRVRKAVALTGLDPADPAQVQRIGAALIIRRLPDTAESTRSLALRAVDK